MRESNTTTRAQAWIVHTILYSVLLSCLCVVSFWLITQILTRVLSVSRDDDLLGGMWAVVATVFVYRYSSEENARAAVSRISATAVSFVLCLIYLLLFPFQPWGMAILVGLGAIIMSLLGRPVDIITTGITTTVVMVVAAMNPDGAWMQPILRVIDTIVGIAVGLVGAWIGLLLTRLSSVTMRHGSHA